MQQQQEAARTEPEASRDGHRRDALEQLREILFGAVFHELERKIARTDAQHLARGNELQYEARRRVEIIESHLRREIDALTARVEHELGEASEAIHRMGREQREAGEAMEHRVAKLEEALGQTHRQLRQDILEQAKSFLDELQDVRRDFVHAIDRRLRLADGEEEDTASDEGER